MHLRRRSHRARSEALDQTAAASPHSRRVVCARLARFGVLVLTLAILAGCGATGGGSGSGTADAVVAVDPVYLPPGQTVAELAWAPSEGPVDNYLVFESRNGEPFGFLAVALTPSVNVNGNPGDSLQITVVAISPTGAMSESSPPSPPLIFQANAETAVARPAPQGLAAPTATLSSDELDVAIAANEAAESETAEATTPEPITDPAADESAPASTLLAESIRSILLGGDARLPESGLSTEARDWLQAHVDHEIAAGVALAGTGHANADSLREVVWQDSAGQLFVSDGETFLGATDLPATLAEGLRLNATERFVGLADFDGDGFGDWLLEDTATGDVWIVSGSGDAAQPPIAPASETTLAGHGDFDGDGVAEILWIDAERGLRLSSARSEAPRLAVGTGQPADTTLLAIADLDGNGRDDLLTRADDGTLVVGFSRDTAEGAPVAIEWMDGAALDAGLDLVATVDTDDDGASEIAWLNGADLEIWTAEDGLRERLTF